MLKRQGRGWEIEGGKYYIFPLCFMNKIDLISQQLFRLQYLTETMTEIERSIDRSIMNSACSSYDGNRSTVKRLFSSVFSMIDGDQEVSHFQEEDQVSKIENIYQNKQFMMLLQNKIRNEGLYEGYNLPILKVSIQFMQNYVNSAYTEAYAQLQYQDIVTAFCKFGQINRIILTSDKKQGYIFFNSFLNAYVALKICQNLNLRGGSLGLCINWVNNHDYHHQLAMQIHTFVNKINWESLFINNYASSNEETSYNCKQNKLTCRYDIQIENEKEFQVARRIIGSKGCNMKRIIEESIVFDNKNYSNDNEILKLRLRGKGSGYKEGPEQQQSNENLHLCVSAKDQSVYNMACGKVEKLLASIYVEYMEFTRKNGKMVELTVKKSIIGQMIQQDQQNTLLCQQVSRLEENESDGYGMATQMYRINPQKIVQLLELRNKARRQLNFSQADRIRNYLRNCGVCLIDEKGRRGKATEVTTWKYIY